MGALSPAPAPVELGERTLVVWCPDWPVVAARRADPALRTVFVLSEGLHVNGSELVRGFASVLPESVVVTGGLDKVVPSGHAEWLAKRCPRAELRLVPEQNQVFFTPGPGKEIEQFRSGTVVVVASIWRPIRITGLSEVIGSWNTIAISVPQMPRITLALAPVMSRPS